LTDAERELLSMTNDLTSKLNKGNESAGSSNGGTPSNSNAGRRKRR
jgi:hypothetical protein